MQYNASVELTASPDDETVVARIFDQLAEHHVAIGATPTGGMDVILTLEATNLRQATVTALALVQAAGLVASGISVLPTTEFDIRAGMANVPPLLSLVQVAERLNVSRQAVLSRIKHGTLPGVRVGNSWAVPAAAVIRGVQHGAVG